MLYHLFQTAISKDITLHVSANNNAMVILFKTLKQSLLELIVSLFLDSLPKIRIQA